MPGMEGRGQPRGMILVRGVDDKLKIALPQPYPHQLYQICQIQTRSFVLQPARLNTSNLTLELLLPSHSPSLFTNPLCHRFASNDQVLIAYETEMLPEEAQR
jgi:hypothetical protein